MVPHSTPAANAAMMPRNACSGVVCAEEAYANNVAPTNIRTAPPEHAKPTTRAGVAQFVEQRDTPQNADEAVHVPQRKRDAKADVTNGEDGQRVGDRPQTSRKHGPDDQMRRLPQVPTDLPRAAYQRGHAPSGKKDSGDHQQRNHNRGDSDGHQLGRRFGGSQPGAGAKAAKNPHDCRLRRRST